MSYNKEMQSGTLSKIDILKAVGKLMHTLSSSKVVSSNEK